MEFIRKCPKCNNDIKYKHKSTYNNGKEKNTLCKKCYGWKTFNNDVKSGLVENGFKNKKHSDETITKMVSAKLDADKSVFKTKEFKSKMSLVTSGKNNGMHGKKVYDIWLDRYGKEEADKKLTELKKKHSINNSGSKNNMYGKPSPQGSGNGWKGWYKGTFFRSLLELSFLVNYVDRFKMKMINAESKQYGIKYKGYENEDRTYFADYIINDKFFVEIKPKKLHNTYSILIKKEAAIEYCKLHNLKYKLIEPIKISTNKIKELLNNQTLKFTQIYEIKFKNSIFA